MNPSLYYAVKPLGINQWFGANPVYYAKFLDAQGNPQKGHMGIDFFAPHATPLYAPCDGDAFYTFDAHGGDGIYIRYPNNAVPTHDIILWHLCSKDDPQYKPLIKTDGSITSVKAGQLIGYTDNSGAPYESSGDHLHFGLLPTDKTGAPLNPGNGYGGCIDPAPYLNGKFAEDINTVSIAVAESSLIANEIVSAPISQQDKFSLLGLLKKVAQAFLNWYTK